MTRRFNLIVAAVLLLVGLPYYWLLADNRPGEAAAKPLHIAELRALAGSMPGQAPRTAQLELVAWTRVPGNLFVAGAGLKRQLLGIIAWRLPVPGGAPIVIDTGMTAAQSDKLGTERYVPAAQARIDKAMREAGLILLTHEHFDHEGGLVALGDPAVFAKAQLNPAQLPGNRNTDLMTWPAHVKPVATLTGSAPVAVAPGVVVIPAPSHTPGSQMIYVRLADGREVLFTGDIATMAQSWRELRARSRLIGDLLVGENRREVYAWLRTIRALKAEAPGLIVVPGHDYEWFKFDERFRGLEEGFRG